jgi:hypothetical protein
MAIRKGKKKNLLSDWRSLLKKCLTGSIASVIGTEFDSAELFPRLVRISMADGRSAVGAETGHER